MSMDVFFVFFKAIFWTSQRGVFLYLYWDQLLSLLVTLESKLLWHYRTQETPSLHLLGDWHCRWLLSCDHWSSLWLSSERRLLHAEFFFLKRLDVQCESKKVKVMWHTAKVQVYSKVYMWLPILRISALHFNPSKVHTHSSEHKHTHLEQSLGAVVNIYTAVPKDT